MKTSARVSDELPSFWLWFWAGTGDKPGYRRIADRWLWLHGLIGFAVAELVTVRLAEVAEKALLPLMAIFVGLTFSWAGNAHALLQSKEVTAVADERKGGIFEYVYTFQLCILIILTVIVVWVVPLLGFPYLLPKRFGFTVFNFVAKCLLYGLISLAFRCSWQAVLGANMLLLIRVRLGKSAK